MSSTDVVSPAWSWLGITVVGLGEGMALLEMTPTEKHGQPRRLRHGGMISALADSAMGRSLRTIKPGVARAMSFDLKLSFISPATVGEPLRASGRVVQAGRRVAVAECRVEAPEGRLVATASGTFAITRNKE